MSKSQKARHKRTDPSFLFDVCDCGDPDCPKVRVGIRNAQIKTYNNTSELIAMCYIPIESVPQLVEWLQKHLGKHVKGAEK